MIEGIGIDMVEIERIAMLYQKYEEQFVSRLLTAKEIRFFKSIHNPNRKIEWLAGRFAAKEAISKGVGTGIRQDLTFKDIEILPSINGKPIVILHKKMAVNIHLSITHTNHYAQAYTIIEVGEKEMI